MTTPNIIHTSTIARFAATVFCFTLAACGPESASDWAGATDIEETDDCRDCEVPADVLGECERRGFGDVVCADDVCSGRWADTDQWSPALPQSSIDVAPAHDQTEVWPCEPLPDVDLCIEIDGAGHVACLRIYEGFGVPVAPACMDTPWLDVGCGMIAATL